MTLSHLYANMYKQIKLSKITTIATRKARTRTLIQLGGLLEKAGITEMFDIKLGEDLQADVTSMDKSAMVLGLLIEITGMIDSHDYAKTKWKNVGIKALKYQ